MPLTESMRWLRAYRRAVKISAHIYSKLEVKREIERLFGGYKWYSVNNEKIVGIDVSVFLQSLWAIVEPDLKPIFSNLVGFNTVALYPKSDQLIESFHCLLKFALIAYDSQGNWTKFIPLISLSHRAVIREGWYLTLHTIYLTIPFQPNCVIYLVLETD